MGIIAWIVLGLIVGMLAKWLMPGRDGGGFIMTVALGIAGALLGGYLGNLIFHLDVAAGFSLKSLIVSVIGAMLLLFIYRKIRS
ncbi:GlsB/YeaQ/YmgE family stress response membrane protein [Edwardsiella tarda]|uniref:GlsB/YeaQ/YmgE family stress response membrane protein n=3 Tax=Edwardsiella tarda TaxID=636 RepID=A0A2A7U4W8_EDWTA|nr:GlsB/YeaQ/YmgE family stress response membrane protein [Edwardsiella tarda]AKH89709.1 GlsB/YeaQ/YmgE family stress response membrane protein [Edwardsiella tarda]ATI63351.1 GlsB/YeaQ/YmgE family stress response membrane protein [Edwardsiella tarda]EFE23801.1 transglycosylase associated protein [Edwardsiella tarda ATCC 23685]PEH73349.1 GlsB/YeaQ/YmgE family stress response membrane protein [Edwardsiella tarda]UAL57616.1 GlsB/YeaQ/YmgE family stress response membrane protein [Edwardsiella tard